MGDGVSIRRPLRAMNICGHIFAWTCVFKPLRSVTRSRIAVFMVRLHLTFGGAAMLKKYVFDFFKPFFLFI